MKPITAKDVMKKEVLTVPADLPVNRVAEFLVESSVVSRPAELPRQAPPVTSQIKGRGLLRQTFWTLDKTLG